MCFFILCKYDRIKFQNLTAPSGIGVWLRRPGFLTITCQHCEAPSRRRQEIFRMIGCPNPDHKTENINALRVLRLSLRQLYESLFLQTSQPEEKNRVEFITFCYTLRQLGSVVQTLFCLSKSIQVGSQSRTERQRQIFLLDGQGETRVGWGFGG